MADDYLSGQMAAEGESLDALTEEVCQWLSQTLGVNITSENYMDELDTGVELCKLQNKLCATLGGDKIKYRDNAEKCSQFARENIDHFVRWCKDLHCHQLFESNDLVNQKSELQEKNEQRHKSVVVCLHQVKQKYDRALRNKKEAKVSKGKEHERVADETDSSNPTSTTQVTNKPDQSDLTKQPSDLLLVQENDNKPNDKDKPKDKDEPLKDEDELKIEVEPKNKGELEREDKPVDTEKPGIAPSEGETTSKEKDGEATTKSAIKVSMSSTPQEPLQQSHPNSEMSGSNQQSNIEPGQ